MKIILGLHYQNINKYVRELLVNGLKTIHFRCSFSSFLIDCMCSRFKNRRKKNYSFESKILAYVSTVSSPPYAGDRLNSQYSIKFSRNGQLASYILRIDDKYYLVINGKKSNGYDFLSSYDLRFSDDGKEFAYVAKKDKKYFVVNNLVYSPNNEKLVYSAMSKENGKLESFIVINGTEGKHFPDLSEYYFGAIFDIIFSPDSKNMAFKIKQKQKQFVVINDKERQIYDFISKPKFTDNTHVEYGAKLGNELLWIVEEI